MDSALTLDKNRIFAAEKFLQTTVPRATKKLISAKKPLWGKMTPQHMTEHLYTVVIGSTIIKSTPPIQPNKSQKQGKDFLIYSENDMPRNLDNPAFRFGLPDYKNFSLEEAKIQLLNSITRFFEIYKGKENSYSFNPFLGDLRYNELIIFHYKHFKHHYTQFRLI